MSRFALVVPPTPFIPRRPQTATAVATPKKAAPKLRTPSPPLQTHTAHSLPQFSSDGDNSTITPTPRHHTSPTLHPNDGTGSRLSEQPSIDVDLESDSDQESSPGESKRQTVIAMGGRTIIQAESLESLVFIHVELPLFPLSAFVPKALQEAANKNSK